MEDEQIIRLLFQRSEAAIPMLQQKFGGLCRSVISHILPDGSGKLLWFDVVPGILYCLTMDSVASEQALLDMAGQLFQPAQENS